MSIKINNSIYLAIIEIDNGFIDSINSDIKNNDSECIPYVWMANVIWEFRRIFTDGDRQSADRIINLINKLLKHNNQGVREFASIGIIESVQSDNDGFSKYIYNGIGEDGKIAWDDVNKFWNKEITIIPDRG